ncbi:MAG: hypothetical protein HQL32_01695 [Planctomycetes bacterium]|nr:hypothetical protein [Planctomycetota bacterium]
MDLGCRSLLKSLQYDIDLIVHKNNTALYQNDNIIRNTYSEIQQATLNHYDYLILDLFNTKTILNRNKYFSRIPYICLHNYFYGYEFNRILYNYHRINEIFQLDIDFNEINQEASTTLRLNKKEQNQRPTICNLKTTEIAIAVGGADPARTYPHWVQVIKYLNIKLEKIKFILVGSANGESDRDKILTECKSQHIHDFVNKASLRQTAGIIGQAELLVCCDGGLMHIAHALNTPTIALFTKPYLPEYRITSSQKNITSYLEANLADIQPQELANKILKNI